MISFYGRIIDNLVQNLILCEDKTNENLFSQIFTISLLNKKVGIGQWNINPPSSHLKINYVFYLYRYLIQESYTLEIDKIKLFENWVRSAFLLRRALLLMRAYEKRPFYSKLCIVILVAITMIYYRI